MEGFIKTPHTLIRRTDLSAPARFLWVVLMSYAKPDGTRCFPGVERLARDMGRDRKAIFRYLTELETAGLIRRHSGRKGSEFATNNYRIQLPIPTIPAQNPPPPCPQNGTLPCPQNGDTNKNQLTRARNSLTRSQTLPRKTRNPVWDGLGGQEKDGRRTLIYPPSSKA